MVLGLLFIVLAAVIRRVTSSDFTRQVALATSLAGQLLFAGGVAESSSSDEVEAFFLTLLVTNALLIGAIADRTHRFLSVCFIVTSAVSIVYLEEAQAIVPLFGPALAAGVVGLMRAEGRIVALGLDELLTPVTAGMLMSALGCLMLSTLYVLPEIADDFTFYPRPWISTVLLGALLLYVAHDVWSAMFDDSAGAAWVVAYASTLLVIGAAMAAPGLILSLLVMTLGLVHGNRLYAGTGVVFLVVFTAAYFYGIDATMLVKSATLVGTGIAVLVARRALLSVAGAQIVADA